MWVERGIDGAKGRGQVELLIGDAEVVAVQGEGEHDRRCDAEPGTQGTSQHRVLFSGLP